ncbi:MAG TPA: DNA-processing protein DprA [Puia sp.]|nr:DNA-processing protein DprA [Puia sp.]
MYTDLPYLISLTQVPQVGSIHARTLLQHFGSAEQIFKSSVHDLENIEGIGRIRAQSIRSFRDFSVAEKEIAFMQRYGIRALSTTDADYPQRILNTPDAPILLFYKGNADLNKTKTVSIVGTRRNSEYGKQITEKIIHVLADYDVLIISGLAFGIDAIAHKTALKQELSTIAVLAHGLASLYPPEHGQLSKLMMKQGGLITEYISHIKAEKHHFPIRNRIVAGISDCTIVTETAVKGGSMITADLANGYNREVFAVPGRISDFKSAGCNWLIRNNQAILLENVHDLVKMMGWEDKSKTEKKQGELFIVLTEPEQRIIDLLKERDQMHIDVINATTGFPNSLNAGALLELEMKDLVCSMPGRIYKLKA